MNKYTQFIGYLIHKRPMTKELFDSLVYLLIKEEQREDHRIMAASYLQYARTGGEPPGCIQRMRECLQKGNWTLTDIDTDEVELQRLIHLYQKNKNGAIASYHEKEAREWLRYARTKNVVGVHACVKYMRENLKKAKLTLDDIGMDENKLQELIDSFQEKPQYA